MPYSRTATSSSLILIDEFGKGTAEIDGQALLAATLNHWLELEPKESPSVIVSTHFLGIKSLLSPSNLSSKIAFQTFAFETHGEELIYLYRLMRGIGLSSQAHHVAAAAGIPRRVIERSRAILSNISAGEPLQGACRPITDFTETCDSFLNLDFDDENVMETLDQILQKVSRDEQELFSPMIQIHND